MSRFGNHLVEKGALTASELDDATQSQVVYGGRLGTNLIELGLMGLDEVEEHLAVYLGVPQPKREWLEKPDRKALAAIRADLAKRHEVLPLRIEGRTLHAALLDPHDPAAVDELSFATGLRVTPYAMAEVRLSALLEHHYGVPRRVRYVDLEAARAATRRAPDETAAETRDNTPSIHDHRALLREDELCMRPLEGEQELIDPETFSTLHQTWHAERFGTGSTAGSAVAGRAERTDDPGEGAPDLVLAPASVAALEIELASAANRDSVSRIALQITRMHTAAAALFVVKGGVLSGLCGDGEAVAERLDGILLPVDAGGAIAGTAASGRPYRGEPARDGMDTRLLAALGRANAREIVVHPVAIRGRVVNLLYADNGPDPVGDIAAAALAALAGGIADAYERLILADKRRRAGTQEPGTGARRRSRSEGIA